ncbi:MAG: SSU ribosomal protein S7p (S5e), partial [uncultured Solirubrobacteraceae bacterium]
AAPRSSHHPARRAGSRLSLQAGPAGHQQGDAGRQEVDRREDRVRSACDPLRAHGQGAGRGSRAFDQGAHPGARGPLPSRRRCDVPGARRGAGPSCPHAGGPLARRVRAQPAREDHGAAARPRAARRTEPAGRGLQAEGRHLPHGAGQQGLRPLPLV